MLGELKQGVKEAFRFIGLALKALVFWRKEPPIVTFFDLIRFVETRSKFVSQRTLFGYVKTRAGTRFTSLFENEEFTKSVNIAKWEIYLACVTDLALYIVIQFHRHGAAPLPKLQSLALRLVNEVVELDDVPPERPQGFGDIVSKFEDRLAGYEWGKTDDREAAFQSSLDALVHWSPIADELKQYDVEPVRNSMRFEWKRIRDQLDQILEGESVLADFTRQTER